MFKTEYACGFEEWDGVNRVNENGKCRLFNNARHTQPATEVMLHCKRSQSLWGQIAPTDSAFAGTT
jgi:hypothetical protein